MTRARTLSKLGSSPSVFSEGAVVAGITTIDASGFNITGVVTATTGTFTSVSVAGTITYNDVTNIDSVGIITAQSDVSIADKIIHTGDTNTAIRFPSADTFTVETGGDERLRIDSSGNVGIGTISPSGLLHISGDTCQLHFTDEDDSASSRIYQSGATFAIDVDQADTKASSVLSFRVDDAEAMRIDSSGNVGIGTDNPDAPLQVGVLNSPGSLRAGLVVKTISTTQNNSESAIYIKSLQVVKVIIFVWIQMAV